MEMKYDLSEYTDFSDDFGITTTDNVEVPVKDEEEEKSLKEKIVQLEKLFVPLLLNLKKNPENAYIHWPNREVLIDKQLENILKITRSVV